MSRRALLFNLTTGKGRMVHLPPNSLGSVTPTDVESERVQSRKAAEAATYEVRQLVGRCRTGSEPGGTLTHAVPQGSSGGFKAARCGAVPGRLSNGWSDACSLTLTCKRCLKRVGR